MKHHLILCDCGSLEHQLILSYDKDEIEDVMRFLYITIHLRTYKNFFLRIIPAIKYIFGHKSKYGDFDEILINTNEAKHIQRYIQDFIESNEA